MSICNSGMDCKLLKTASIVIDVTQCHPLMKLMNTIDWGQLSKLIIPDLKKSTCKLKWWLGRKLKLRTHLGIYLLQQLLNETDRGIERQVRDNAVYAIFCGKLFVHNWSVPDHTKIEEFRSRLSPETQCALSKEITRLAARKGFAKPEHVDIDSTIQAPDMQYPATINLLLKTAIVGRRIQKILKRKIPDVVKDHIPVEFRLCGDALSYMEIAHQFTTFREALHYVGERTLGFPLFDYLFLYLDSNSSLLSKVNHICLTLFLVYELTALWVCFVCVKCGLFTTSSVYFSLLFLALAAYPALVMHTTAPLTDVFGMDLLLIGFSLFAWATDETLEFGMTLRWVCTILLGLITGAELSYLIFVRPAYWPGVVGFLMVYPLMTGVRRLLSRRPNYHQSILMSMVTLVVMTVVIMPVMDHCKARYHTVCLQDPYTFSIASFGMGLRDESSCFIMMVR